MSRTAVNRIVAFLAAACIGAGGGIAAYAALHDGGTTTVVRAAAAAQPAAAQTAALSVNEIYRRTRGSVVQVSADSGGGPSPFGDRGERRAQGSGFVYDSAGRVVTNQHVVDGADSVTVTYSDGTTRRARVVATDPSTDIAVLEVTSPKADAAPLELADSGAVRVGDGVVAIGSPFGLAGTVTSGIVSALHREIDGADGAPIEDAIQTDAAINHGNSGGPLLDAQGRVIGITSQIESDGGGNDGVGFAIPSNTVRRIADQLIASGKVEHALLGVRVEATDSGRGVRIENVQPGSGAARAGLKTDDVIVRAGGQAVATPQGLRRIVDARKPGDRLRLVIRRDGNERTVTATLGSRS
jgi:putative serine protease PepD